MTDLDLDAIEARANAALNSPTGQSYDVGVILSRDVPALVAALREARAEVERLRTASVLDDIESMSPNRNNGERYGSVSWRLIRERDDWRRRYEALRDAVLGHCADFPFPIDQARALRAVVARVEGDES